MQQINFETIKDFSNYPEQYCEELNVENVQVSSSGSQREGTVVTVTCFKPKRYVLMGRKQVTCLANGSWSETPECRKCGKF